jgi:hypothetical protein
MMIAKTLFVSAVVASSLIYGAVVGGLTWFLLECWGM